uniref:Dedicator of cytokinesis C/D N-terminal domain-containing protein n=1 Tax=Acrobeloides nanus TaxID=290746 RepID=A0A914BWF7_9BILA
MKRSKVSAAEIRRQIVEGNYLFHNSPTLVQNSNVTIASEENGASQKITLSEVTAPIDIEEALSSRLIARSEIKSTSLSPQRIRDLTEKDVELVNVPRIKHVKPEITSFENGQIEHHIKDLLKSYDKDYVVVEHKHAGFGSGESFKKISSTRSQLVTSMPVQIFESDFDHDPVKQRKVTIQNEEKRQSTYSSSSSSSKDSQPEQLNSSASDSVIPDVLLRSSCTKLDDIHEKKRASNRISYIVNLLPLPDESEVVEIRKTPSIPSNLSAQCMLIRILQVCKFTLHQNT